MISNGLRRPSPFFKGSTPSRGRDFGRNPPPRKIPCLSGTPFTKGEIRGTSFRKGGINPPAEGGPYNSSNNFVCSRQTRSFSSTVGTYNILTFLRKRECGKPPNNHGV